MVGWISFPNKGRFGGAITLILFTLEEIFVREDGPPNLPRHTHSEILGVDKIVNPGVSRPKI